MEAIVLQDRGSAFNDTPDDTPKRKAFRAIGSVFPDKVLWPRRERGGTPAMGAKNGGTPPSSPKRKYSSTGRGKPLKCVDCDKAGKDPNHNYWGFETARQAADKRRNERMEAAKAAPKKSQ